jgi:chorismate mutase
MAERRRPADPLDKHRRLIDGIDRKVVKLLNQRAGHALALGRIKRKLGLPIYQPDREEEVLRNVQGVNGGPLKDEALRRLFERIIDESRRLERLATEGPEAGPGRTPGGPGGTED